MMATTIVSAFMIVFLMTALIATAVIAGYVAHLVIIEIIPEYTQALWTWITRRRP